MKKVNRRWWPPKGYVAVQPYVKREVYELLKSLAEYNGRSLRKEAERILNEAAEKWKEKQDN